MQLREKLISSLLFFLGVFCCWPTLVLAAVEDVVVTPSTQQAAAAANYRIDFTVSTLKVDTIDLTITFSSFFDRGDIDGGDVDILVDGVEISTNSSNCAGTEKLLVGFSGQSLNISGCPGDGFTSGAGAAYTVLIGLTADSYGTGDEQITNPTGENRSYGIAIDGTAVWVPILDTAGEGSVVINVIGPPPGSDGGGGGSSGGPGPSPSPSPQPTPTPQPTPEPQPTPTPEPTPEPAPEPEPEPATPEPAPTPTPTPSTPTVIPSPSSESDPSSPSTPSPTDTSDNSTGGGTTVPLPGDIDRREISGEIQTSFAILPIGAAPIGVPGGLPAQIRIWLNESDPDAQVVVVLGGQEVALLSSDGRMFTGEVVTPYISSALEVRAIVGGQEVIERSTFVPAFGSVIGRGADGSLRPMAGVTVELLSDGRTVVTDGEGRYPAWLVRPGTYEVRVRAEGFEDATVSVSAEGYQLAADVVLQEFVGSPWLEDAPRATAIQAALTNIVGERVANAVSRVAAVFESPEAEAAAEVAAPVATVATTASVASAAMGGAPILPYLQYLFTSPVLFFSRRRRTVYGTVYNAITKVPVGLVTVRILDAATGRVVRSVVTNPLGQYAVPVRDAGRYRVEVKKDGYQFPSLYAKGLVQDGKFANVLTTSDIAVDGRDVLVAPNIPIDPAERPATEVIKKLYRQRSLQRLQYLLAPLGVFGASFVALTNPTPRQFLIVGVQVILLVLTAKISWPKKPKGWGMVRDEKTGKAVPNAIVRLFEPRYNKLVETVLTDRQGRYALLLGPNTYQTRFDKAGYLSHQVNDLDFRTATEPQALTLQVKLQHGENPKLPQTP